MYNCLHQHQNIKRVWIISAFCVLVVSQPFILFCLVKQGNLAKSTQFTLTTRTDSMQLTWHQLPSSQPHLTNLPLGRGAQPLGNFKLIASFNLHTLPTPAPRLNSTQGGVFPAMSHYSYNSVLLALDGSLSPVKHNPHYPPTRTSRANDAASFGIGGSTGTVYCGHPNNQSPGRPSAK